MSGADGINLWMGVVDERSATVALATRGIGAAPGEPFMVRPDDDHLRVTVGLITGPDEQWSRSPSTSPPRPAALPARTEPPPLRVARRGDAPRRDDVVLGCDDLDEASSCSRRGSGSGST